MDLNEVRKNIDIIDAEVVRLINERIELALRAKKLKDEIVDDVREGKVVDHVRSYSQYLIDPDFIEKIFTDFIEESKRIQCADLSLVGFQGEHGAYGEVAVRKWRENIVPIPCLEFADVFEDVKSGRLDFGVVPVENSLEGAVTQVNDLLIETDLKVIGEVRVPITHCLLAPQEADYRDIRVVYSHPQALAQCRNFLARNDLEPTPFYDTAGAAKMISKKRPRSAAAIASELCAKLYNLDIVKKSIEDHKANVTRFLVISREPSEYLGNKCSIIFSTKHEAGALFTILSLFADHNINLTRIASRPVRDNPECYHFLMDFLGNDKDPTIEKILEEVRNHADVYKFLGCYEEMVL